MDWVKEKEQFSDIEIYGNRNCVPETCSQNIIYYFKDMTAMELHYDRLVYKKLIQLFSSSIPISKLNSVIHRDDGPAIEYYNGTKQWYQDGKLHREDGPAIEYANGDDEYYINGKHHREDGPAIEYVNGDKEYYINGKAHRIDGPAIERINGYEEWYINGKLHREDGPAVINKKNNLEKWYINGKLHREDGPAVIKFDITKKEFYTDSETMKGGFNTDDKNYSISIKEKYSIIYEEWYKHGQLHREDGPAIINKIENLEKHYINGVIQRYINHKTGEFYIYKEGLLHTDNHTPIIDKDGTMIWYKMGVIHRENGPAKIYKNGNKEWLQNNKLHRKGGPAVDNITGLREWYINGVLHRTDGPAQRQPNGIKRWYINGNIIKYGRIKQILGLLKKYDNE